MYTGVIRPVLIYTGGTTPDASKTKQMTETAEMGTWRKTVRKTRSEGVRNQDIRRQYDIQDVREGITGRRGFEDGTRKNCKNCESALLLAYADLADRRRDVATNISETTGYRYRIIPHSDTQQDAYSKDSM
jgi:hypothetical protein